MIRSTNINKTHNYLSHLIIEQKKPQHMALEIQVLAWDIYKNMACLKRSMGSFFIIGSPMAIQI
jgi:hypothetical protein